MIPSFPFFRPNMYYNPYKYNHYNSFNHNFGVDSSKNNVNFPIQKETDTVHRVPTFDVDSSKYNDNEYFEIFGIHLFFDDILILCLLFFLYEENVNDQLLFVALLLLLMS